MLKRSFDIIVAAVALFILSPLFFWIMIKVVSSLGKPVFFTQKRPGLHAKTFKMIKFRSMLHAFDENGNALADSKRLTSFGKKIRSLSLDELPELWNVLKGDMSLVGPRPLLIEYLPLYSKEQATRHNVRPGITGWAQVNGRNAISWEEKFALDIWYVDNHNFWLDVRILFLTLKSVFSQDGISHEGEVTMSKFSGNQ